MSKVTITIKNTNKQLAEHMRRLHWQSASPNENGELKRLRTQLLILKFKM